jgi:hypothetical protein
MAVGLVSLPLSVALTLAMMPMWRWIEARYQIEAIGHSGPADWCFMAMFLACVVVTGGFYVFVVDARTNKGA